jgi:3-hydroxymyristoyl/3-hydroxydecanoyl-(acyl carrier protein) dehydratase
VLRYILSLRFRDAAAPGARNTVAAKNKKENASYRAKYQILPVLLAVY